MPGEGWTPIYFPHMWGTLSVNDRGESAEKVGTGGEQVGTGGGWGRATLERAGMEEEEEQAKQEFGCHST